jgi:hypothetical protein
LENAAIEVVPMTMLWGNRACIFWLVSAKAATVVVNQTNFACVMVWQAWLMALSTGVA